MKARIKTGNTIIRRLLSILLCMSLICSLIPVNVFAEEDIPVLTSETEAAVQEETSPPEQTEAVQETAPEETNPQTEEPPQEQSQDDSMEETQEDTPDITTEAAAPEESETDSQVTAGESAVEENSEQEDSSEEILSEDLLLEESINQVNEDQISDLTMNNYRIEWISGSTATVINGDNLSITPSSNGLNTVTARVYFSVGGNEGVNTGDAQIKLPAYLFRDREGNPIGNVTLSIPKAPETGGVTSFNYTIDDNGTPDDPNDDYILIKNYKEIGKGGFIMKADIVWDFEPATIKNGYENNEINAEFSVVGKASGEKQVQHSDNLAVTVNTKVNNPTVTKNAVKKREGWLSDWGEKPEDADDYYYVTWQLRCYVPNSGTTSAYTTYFEEIPDDGGEFVGWSKTYTAQSSTSGISAPANSFTLGTLDEFKADPVYTATKAAEINITSAYAARDVIMRYPKSATENGATPKVSNTFRATVVTPDGEMKQKVALGEYTYEHVSLGVPYPGDVFSMYKRAHENYTASGLRTYSAYAAAINVLRSGNSVEASWSIAVHNDSWSRTYGVKPAEENDGEDNGEDAEEEENQKVGGVKAYETVLRDGMMYVGGERLQPGDYELTKFYPNEYNIDVPYYDEDRGYFLGVGTQYDKYEPIQVYVRSGNGAWQHYGDLTKTTASTYNWKGADGSTSTCTGSGSAISLPAGTTDIKYVHSGKEYGVNYRMSLFYKLKPSEHLMGLIGESTTSFDLININEAWGEQDGKIYTPGNTFNNSSTPTIKQDVETSDKEHNGEVMHDYSTHTFTGTTGTGSFSKALGTGKNDTGSARLIVPVTLTWDYYFNYSKMGINIEQAIDAKVINEARESVFYDLLPKGVTVDLDSIKVTTYSIINLDSKTMPPCDYTVEMVDNWRDSGQTMMILRVSAPEGYRNFAKSSTYLDTGFKVYFNMIDTWDNISANGSKLTNQAAMYGLDGSVPGGFADECNVPAMKDNFDDLDNNGITGSGDKNVKYASTTKNYVVPMASQMGFTKKVKGAGDTAYTDKTAVPATGGYSYQLRFALAQDAKAKGVVMYDVLETAHEASSRWNGTFKSIDVSQIKAQFPNTDVKIYYSVSKEFGDLDVNSGVDYFSLDSGLWTTEKPEDVSKVTAIAIDISKDKNGNIVEYKGETAVSAQIYMNSPANYQELADNPETTPDETVYAYNKAYIKADGQEIEGSQTVKTSVTKPNVEIRKSATPVSGSESAPRIVAVGDTITYRLDASNNNKADAISDVIIEDTIPEWLNIQMDQIEFYFGSQISKKAKADGTGRVGVTADGQKLTFTVDKLAANETVHLLIPTVTAPTAAKGVTMENGAAITGFNGYEWDFESNKTYHKTMQVQTSVPVKKIWEDQGNLYGKRRDVTIQLLADGTPVEGKTMTLRVSGSQSGTFTNLPKYEEDGVTEIVYTVEEAAVPGYITTYGKNADGTLTVTNKANILEGNKSLTLKVKKLRSNSELVVPGTEFVIKTADGATLQTKTTDNSGFATFVIEPEGTDDYSLLLYETAAPHGYILEEEPITILLHREETYDDDLNGNAINVKYHWTAEMKNSNNWDASFDAAENELTVKNQYQPTPAEVVIPVQKLVTGAVHDAQNGPTFEFALTGEEDAPLPVATGRTIWLQENGSRNFGKITFTKTGTYKYYVKEKKGTAAGYTYDAKTHEVVVAVTDEDGYLKTAMTVDGQTASDVKITNTYEPLAVQLQIPVEKIIEGNLRPDNQKETFNFVLTGLRGAPMPEADGAKAKITDAGKAAFGSITFKTAGTYQYTVVETAGNKPGYTYDTEAHTITVTATDVEGQLTASWTSDAAVDRDSTENDPAVCFTNTYVPTAAELKLPVRKLIEGNERAEKWKKTFTFQLTAKDQAPLPESAQDGAITASVTDAGTSEFAAITFAEAGVYTYEAEEVQGRETGYGYETKKHIITVTVTDDNGVLSAVWTSDQESDSTAKGIVFTNTYTPEPVSLKFPVKKVIGGEPLPYNHVDRFTFHITGSGNAPMPEGDGSTATISGDGESEFGKITFTSAGTYLYSVTEEDNKLAGYVYDRSTHLLEVIVTDEDGKLKAAWTDDGETAESVIYENDYEPDAAVEEIEISKTIIGNERSDKYLKGFEFELIPIDGNKGDADLAASELPMPISKYGYITDKGTAVIGQIAFKSAGSYHYQIKETKGSEPGYTYDNTVYDVYVTTRDIGGKITADITTKKGTEESDVTFKNEYHPQAAKAEIAVGKIITGNPRPSEKKFTFILTGKSADKAEPMPEGAENGIAKTEVTGSAQGTAEGSFAEITFDKAGIYQYTVKEDAAVKENGYTYDLSAVNVTVTVEDMNGVLKASVAYEKDDAEAERALFTNAYEPKPAELSVAVQKVITGNDRSAEFEKEFRFRITPVNGAPAPEENSEITITDAGEGFFGKIVYQKAGVYLYQVSETEEDEHGYTYDPSVRTVKVTVTDHNGDLYASYLVDENTDEVVFTNHYELDPVTAVIPVEKIVTGNDRVPEYQKEFTFNLSAEDGTPMPEEGGEICTIKDQGKAAFGSIIYTKAGDYTYKVEETAGSERGYIYDSDFCMVTVHVTDNDGSLEAEVTAEKKNQEEKNPVFTNTYTPVWATLDIPVVKIVSGNERPEKKVFTFTLSQGEDVLDTKTIEDEGTVNFDTQTFTKAGSYTYQISEVLGEDHGYTYADEIHTITVKVTDEDGTLKAEMTEGEESVTEVSFTNLYKPDEVQFAIPVTKKIAGNKRVEGQEKEFTFILEGSDQAPMPEEGSEVLTITDEGTASFGMINYTAAGEYHYKVSEKAGSETGYSYDETVYDVTVKIKDIDGVLGAAWSVDEEEKTDLVFTNSYAPEKVSVVLPVEKEVKGDPVPESQTYQFALKENGVEVSKLEIKDSGKAEFAPLVFDEAGTYRYTVSETAGTLENMTYDAHVYNITIIVTDENGVLKAEWNADESACEMLKFTNQYTAQQTEKKEDKEKDAENKDINEKKQNSSSGSASSGTAAKTGDQTPFEFWIIMTAMSLMLSGILILMRKRKTSLKNMK